MPKLFTLGVVLAVAVVGVPGAAFLWSQPAEDQLSLVLRDLGFVPITPPTNLMSVGSLYYVDPEVRFFSPICHPEASDLDGVVKESRSGNFKEELLHKGRFATNVKVDVGASASGKLDRSYEQKVHYSLTDVFVEEITLGHNRLIFAKVMAKRECQDVVMDMMEQGGYVCQGHKILRATAEFKVDVDRNGGMGGHVKLEGTVLKDAVKRAVESQSDQSVVERSGRLFAGSALKYGVAMNPTCLAPTQGRFARVLPRSMLGRFRNFVLFRIVEPLLPTKDEQTMADLS
jgi:hypothetical protein